MVFASPLFLSVYIPLLCLIYAAVPLRWRNAVLLAACTVFYGAGAGEYFFLFFGLTAVRVLLGRYTLQNPFVTTIAIALNLIPLVYYKYSSFLGHFVLDLQGEAYEQVAKGLLPLGISLYTFLAISNIFDVSMGRIRTDERGFRNALYVFSSRI